MDGIVRARLRLSLASIRHCRSLSILSWNTNGVEERCRKTRTKEICRIINHAQPHAAFLQEVVPFNWKHIITHCSEKYHCFCSPDLKNNFNNLSNSRCFQAILFQKSSIAPSPDTPVKQNCPLSIAGALYSVPLQRRDLLILPISHFGIDIQLMTAHLKAGGTERSRRERIEELEMVAEEIYRVRENGTICILAGDLNLRDGEINKIQLPPETVDIWEFCGAKEKLRYTWDPNTNRNIPQHWKARPYRFDRFYLSPYTGYIRPQSFSLVGLEPLPCCGRQASDHWGIMVDFKMS